MVFPDKSLNFSGRFLQIKTNLNLQEYKREEPTFVSNGPHGLPSTSNTSFSTPSTSRHDEWYW